MPVFLEREGKTKNPEQRLNYIFCGLSFLRPASGLHSGGTQFYSVHFNPCSTVALSTYGRGFQMVLSQGPPFGPESNPRPTDVPVIPKIFYSPVPFFFMFVTAAAAFSAIKPLMQNNQLISFW